MIGQFLSVVLRGDEYYVTGAVIGEVILGRDRVLVLRKQDVTKIMSRRIWCIFLRTTVL